MPIMTIGFLAAQISRAGASALRVFELLDAPVEVTDAPDAMPLPPLAGRVEFDDVRFRYAGSEREILRGVSFTVEPGQTGRDARHHRRRQEHDDQPDPALLRRDRRRGARRRARRARGDAVEPALADRRRAAGGAALLRHRARQHRLRPARRDARATMRAAAEAAQAREFIDDAAAGLRHDHRRARRRALGRPAPAHRHRARAADRSAPAHPRRQHLGRRRRDRERDPGRARSPDARLAAHRVRHRAAHLARCATPT